MSLQRRFLALAAPLALACVPAAATAATPADGAIVFSHARYDAAGIATRSHLLLDDGGRVRVLTPSVAGTFDRLPGWSPDGSRIVFERTTSTAKGGQRTHLYSVDRRTGRIRALTRGVGSYLAPAWGPGSRIAYVARTATRDCLGVMGAGGAPRRNLFCVAAPIRLEQPSWSGDGRALLVAAGAWIGRMDPQWHALAYRVDTGSGASTKLLDLTTYEERRIAFSPDGSRGVLADVVPNTLTLVDFASGTRRDLGVGYAPRWSRDGLRIAYTGEVYDDGAGGFRYYNPLYVMDRNGAHARRVTAGRTGDVAWLAADWSRDGSRVLATRRSFRDPALVQPLHALRIVDVASGSALARPAGYAVPGAWFER
jgi:dipeptidyl aminopeptidase/acylaminoacyl peptidase